MITRLRLGIDASPGSRQAEAMALGLAKQHGAFLDAVVAIDTPWLDRPQAVGIGGSAFKLAAEASILRATHARAKQIVNDFRKAAEAAGVAHAIRVVEGAPAEVIEAGAVACDLVVIGRDATFWGDDGKPTSSVARGILHVGSRPVLLVPPQLIAGDAILIAFDGSAPAARSLHMLALLGLAVGRRVTVLSIADDQALADERATAAMRLLHAHGVADAAAVGLCSGDEPAGIILRQAQDLGAGIVAMGAFGHNGLRELLFGSCTSSLLRSSPIALFVHH
jgi:nucleotide-binding universal stress UspA family protein